MPSILYPWKTTSIIKDAASVIQPPKKGGKGQGSGGGSVGKGGQGNGLGKGRGGGAGGGSTPPSGGSVDLPAITANLYNWFDANYLTTYGYSDAAGTTIVTDGDPIELVKTTELNAAGIIAQPYDMGQLDTADAPTYNEGVINGLPALSITAVNQYLCIDGPISDYVPLRTNYATLFIVVNQLDSSGLGEGNVIHFDSSSDGLKAEPNGTYFRSRLPPTSTDLSVGPTYTRLSSTPIIITYIIGPTEVSIQVNQGTAVTGGGYSSGSNCQYWAIGTYTYNNSTKMNVGEVLHYNGVMGSSDIATMQASLADKWGITL